MDLDVMTMGWARIDLSQEVLNLPDAAAESVMVNAVVQTLTEFPTIETVRFLVGGQEMETLTHGTSVSGDFPPQRAQFGKLFDSGGGRADGHALISRAIRVR